MTTRMPWLFGAALLLVTGGTWAASKLQPTPGARNWTHVRSMVIPDAEDPMHGFHDVYANPSALEALKAGKAVPPGGEFALFIHDVAKDGDALVPGALRRQSFQRKDPAAKETAGWAYSSFDAQGKPVEVDAKECHACHVAQAKDRDYVIVRYVP